MQPSKAERTPWTVEQLEDGAVLCFDCGGDMQPAHFWGNELPTRVRRLKTLYQPVGSEEVGPMARLRKFWWVARGTGAPSPVLR